jgi:hypothetical protein
MKFTQEVLNGFEMTARVAATEISAARPDHRAFISIYPPSPGKNIRQWRVRRFEIPKHLIERYLGEEQLVDSQFVSLDTLDQVYELLTKWNLDGAMFKPPWDTDYPL